MYKNLCAEALGISGRQSELIELALTFGFKGFDLNVGDLLKRVELQGADHTFRFIKSAKIKIGGFELPVRWQGAEASYKKDLATLGKVAEIARSVDALRCFTTVPAATDEAPFKEYFEQTRHRIGEIADVLQPYGVRLGLAFNAAPSFRQDRQFEFIHQAEVLLTLIKTIGGSTVGLALDSWNWRVGGGRVEQLKSLAGNQIVTVRVADVPDGVDLETIDVKQRLLPGESEKSDVAPLLALLAEKNYDGPITIYSHPSQFSRMTRDAIMQKAMKSLDTQWKAAGLSKVGKAAEVAEPVAEAVVAAETTGA